MDAKKYSELRSETASAPFRAERSIDGADSGNRSTNASRAGTLRNPGSRRRPSGASHGFARTWQRTRSRAKQTWRAKRENSPGVASGRKKRDDCRRAFEKAESAERQSLRLVQWHGQKRSRNQEDRRREISAQIAIKLRALV